MVDGEELLPERPGPALLRTQARRRALAVIAVLLFAGALAARVATSGHGAAPAPVGLPAPTSIPEPEQLARFDASVFPYDPTVCPSNVRCAAATDVPTGVLAAVRERAPGAKSRVSRDVRVLSPKPALWFRELDATAAGVKIEVIVKQAVPHADSVPVQESDPTGPAPTGIVRINTRGFAVSAQFTGPAGYRPPMAAIRALAADPRLLAAG